MSRQVLFDLNYEEDANAQVDANFVICESGKIIEIQVTGEEYAFTNEQFKEIFELSRIGISKIIQNNLNGLLYKPGDFKELAQIILRLMEDSYFRKSCSNIGIKNAHKLIKRESAGEFTAKVISNYFHSIHKNLEE